MRSIRTLRTRSVAALAAVPFVVVGAGVAVARATDGPGPVPPPAKLDVAIRDALTAQAPAGVTARIRFSNNVIASGALPDGVGSALLAGATGRLWAGSSGVRLELQSARGDTQIVAHDGTLTVYDASSNTVYRFTRPAGAKRAPTAHRDHAAPSLARVDALLAELARRADVAGPTPTDVAGEAAYSVRISPKHDGGLLGAAELAWDARHGVPLRAAIYAQGDSTPVLELTATDIAFGAVPSSTIDVAPPAGAKVVQLAVPSGNRGAEAAPGTSGGTAPTVPSPATLVGLPRTVDRAVDWKGSPARVLVYGRGLGALVVVARTADTSAKAGAGPLAQLPSVALGTATGHELPTALGTVLTARKSGVDYLVIGSLPPSAAEAAARELLQ
jgi:outer membrane lipoprotein-sorting protein